MALKRYAVPVFVVAVALWLFAVVSMQWHHVAQTQDHGPQTLSELVWELDASVHRLLMANEFSGDDSYELERSRLADVIERAKNFPFVHGSPVSISTEAGISAASNLMAAMERSDRVVAMEQAALFRDAITQSERRLAQVSDGLSSAPSRSDGQSVFLVLVSGIMMITVGALALRRSLTASKTPIPDSNQTQSNPLNEQIVARENELAALRGQMDELVKERDAIQSEMEFIKSDWQKQRLVNSALEAKLRAKS